MRILQVVTRSELGGAQSIVADLSRDLHEAGHRVTIASGPQGQGTAWLELPPQIDVVTVPHLVRELHPIQDVLAVRELGRLYRSLRPDIVHLHTSKAGTVGRLARGVPRRRIVYTMHGFGQLQVSNARLLFIDRALRSACGAIVAVSAEDEQAMVAEGYHPRLIVNGCPDVRVPHRLGADVEQALVRARSAGLPMFLMTARDAPPKRVDLARAAATELRDRAVVLWVGGDGRPGDPASFVSLGAANARAVLPWVDGALFLSDHEGLPMSLLEALSAGLPCVASDIPGCREALSGGSGAEPVGLLVANQIPPIVEALERLAGDAALREQLGAAARALWEQRYSTARMGADYVRLYEELRRGS